MANFVGDAEPLTVRIPGFQMGRPLQAGHISRDDTGAPLNAMTIDVEDYFQVEAFAKFIDRDTWDRLPPRVEGSVDRFLNLLSAHNVFATFFILGWIAERFPSLVRRIAAGGHEIASHGYAHMRVDQQTPDAFRQDVRLAKNMLENITANAVKGYRAPTFSIREECWWAYEILTEEGYSYSSSIYPITHDLYGMPDAPRAPFHPIDGPFVEIPLTTIRFFNRNFPCSGGGYFRLLPYTYSRSSMRRVNREGLSCIFYCHPWEFDLHQPRIAGASWKSRFRHYTNIASMPTRLTRLLNDFAWGRMDRTFVQRGYGG